MNIYDITIYFKWNINRPLFLKKEEIYIYTNNYTDILTISILFTERQNYPILYIEMFLGYEYWFLNDPNRNKLKTCMKVTIIQYIEVKRELLQIIRSKNQDKLVNIIINLVTKRQLKN
jgi:hypothetical protein